MKTKMDSGYNSRPYWETLMVEHVVPSQKLSSFVCKTSEDNKKTPKYYKANDKLKKLRTPVQ